MEAVISHLETLDLTMSVLFQMVRLPLLLQGTLSSVSSSPHVWFCLTLRDGLCCFHLQLHGQSLVTSRDLGIPSTLFSISDHVLPRHWNSSALYNRLFLKGITDYYQLAILFEMPKYVCLEIKAPSLPFWNIPPRLLSFQTLGGHTFQQKLRFLKKYFGRQLTMISTYTPTPAHILLLLRVYRKQTR